MKKLNNTKYKIMETNYTSAPWIISNQDKNGIFITDIKNSGSLARVYTSNDLVNSLDTAKANAKLIAAAPDMLKTLQIIIPYLKSNGFKEHEGIMVWIENSIKNATE